MSNSIAGTTQYESSPTKRTPQRPATCRPVLSALFHRVDDALPAVVVPETAAARPAAVRRGRQDGRGVLRRIRVGAPRLQRTSTRRPENVRVGYDDEVAVRSVYVPATPVLPDGIDAERGAVVGARPQHLVVSRVRWPATRHGVKAQRRGRVAPI